MADHKDNILLINGNEAAAYAAIDAHIGHFSHYPGSPVNKVEPKLKKLNTSLGLDIQFNDAHNEHIAACSSLGASLSNVRSMLVMKHVGINIAADPLTYAGYSGTRGGLVLLVGTDPGANSSTGEQDVHWYARMFNFPLFEPTGIQEIYDQCLEGFELSERLNIPVMVFLPVELAHTLAHVNRKQTKPSNREIGFIKNRAQYINVGKKAIKNHKKLIGKIHALEDQIGYFQKSFNPNAPFGIITRGLTYNYVKEKVIEYGLENRIDLLHLQQVYPVPKQTIAEFAKNKSKIVCIEDQDGFMEMVIKQACFNEIQCAVHGKDIFPEYGALSSDIVGDYLREEFELTVDEKPTFYYEIEERLGTFCEGCPHTASYYGIFSALEGKDYVLGGDIGCSSLPPFRADWLLCMNAGIGISQGIAQVSTEQVVVSTGGDGSFFHGGMISLQSAVENNINLIHIVFDNSYVAMTGHQYSPSAGQRFDISGYLESIGVDRYYLINVFEKDALKNTLRSELDQKGVRVIWAQGACALATEAARKDEPFTYKVEIHSEHCDTCTICYEDLACPAIKRDDSTSPIFIDDTLCVRCGTCHGICPNDAIHFTDLITD